MDGGHSDRVVQNPELLPLEGKRLSEIATLWNESAFDAMCDLLIRDHAAPRSPCSACPSRCRPGLAAALGVDRQRLAGHIDRGLLAAEHPHPRL